MEENIAEIDKNVKNEGDRTLLKLINSINPMLIHFLVLRYSLDKKNKDVFQSAQKTSIENKQSLYSLMGELDGGKKYI